MTRYRLVARGIGGMAVAGRERVRDWFGRFHSHKEAKGLSSVADMRGRFKNWIEPAIGDKAMNAVAPADIEAIVEKLDEAFGAWRAAAGERGEGEAIAFDRRERLGRPGARFRRSG